MNPQPQRKEVSDAERPKISSQQTNALFVTRSKGDSVSVPGVTNLWSGWWVAQTPIKQAAVQTQRVQVDLGARESY